MTGKILIVEDDRILSLLLKTLLKNMGLEIVGVASSCDEALRVISGMLPDVILMDIKIKGHLDGIDTTREIKKIVNLPVIYTSGNSDPATLKRARELGYSAFLLKPVVESELRAELEKAINSKN